VTYVSAAPGGSQPSDSLGYTIRDNDFYVAWDKIARDRETFLAWVDEYVLHEGREETVKA
jgi:glutaconate CoA-transferase, subunit A